MKNSVHFNPSVQTFSTMKTAYRTWTQGSSCQRNQRLLFYFWLTSKCKRKKIMFTTDPVCWIFQASALFCSLRCAICCYPHSCFASYLLTQLLTDEDNYVRLENNLNTHMSAMFITVSYLFLTSLWALSSRDDRCFPKVPVIVCTSLGFRRLIN